MNTTFAAHGRLLLLLLRMVQHWWRGVYHRTDAQPSPPCLHQPHIAPRAAMQEVPLDLGRPVLLETIAQLLGGTAPWQVLVHGKVGRRGVQGVQGVGAQQAGSVAEGESALERPFLYSLPPASEGGLPADACNARASWIAGVIHAGCRFAQWPTQPGLLHYHSRCCALVSHVAASHHHRAACARPGPVGMCLGAQPRHLWPSGTRAIHSRTRAAPHWHAHAVGRVGKRAAGVDWAVCVWAPHAIQVGWQQCTVQHTVHFICGMLCLSLPVHTHAHPMNTRIYFQSSCF